MNTKQILHTSKGIEIFDFLFEEPVGIVANPGQTQLISPRIKFSHRKNILWKFRYLQPWASFQIVFRQIKAFRAVKVFRSSMSASKQTFQFF
jgi:hypothetical protein